MGQPAAPPGSGPCAPARRCVAGTPAGTAGDSSASWTLSFLPQRWGAHETESTPVAGLSSATTNTFAALAYFRNLAGQQWSQSVKLPGLGYLLTVSAARQKYAGGTRSASP